MSWGDPWSRAFEGVGRAFGNYYDNKARLQEKEEDRAYLEEADKRKEAAAEKARQAREKAERNAGIVFEAFSPEGKLTTLTRGDLSGGATLPDWELDRQRQAQLAAQAEAEASGVERQAKLDKLQAETGAASARAEASRARASQQGLSRGGRGSGLAKPTPTPSDAIIKSVQEAAQRMIMQDGADSVKIKARLESIYPPELVAKALGTYREPSVMSTDTLFGTNPTVDDLLGSYPYK